MLNAPPKPPHKGLAGRGISCKGQATSGFWLPFLCLFRQRTVQGPEGRKCHLQCILHSLKKRFWSPKSTLVLDWEAFWASERDSHSADLHMFRAFQTLQTRGRGGEKGRGLSREPEWGPWRQAEGGPTRDQRPRKEQRVWSCPFTHSAIHNAACSAKSSPATASSGPSWEGGTASGSVPLAQQDS